MGAGGAADRRSADELDGCEALGNFTRYLTRPTFSSQWVIRVRFTARAWKITDLWTPPGNRPKSLEDDLFSIRINDQWRIVFEWTEDGAENVEIIDYHD